MVGVRGVAMGLMETIQSHSFSAIDWAGYRSENMSIKEKQRCGYDRDLVFCVNAWSLMPRESCPMTSIPIFT